MYLPAFNGHQQTTCPGQVAMGNGSAFENIKEARWGDQKSTIGQKLMKMTDAFADGAMMNECGSTKEAVE